MDERIERIRADVEWAVWDVLHSDYHDNMCDCPALTKSITESVLRVFDRSLPRKEPSNG